PVDLDGDGDLDYVINNINDVASVYRNNTNEKNEVKKNFIEIAFKGGEQNKKGIGAWAEVYYGKAKQVYENEPVRGYLSCVEAKAFFGLDTVKILDSVVVRWPNNTRQVMKDVRVNQHLVADVANANLKDAWSVPALNKNALFTEVTKATDVQYRQWAGDYIDFDKERLLPHKLSQYTPSLAVGDVDGNGLDDVFIGGKVSQPGTFLLQQTDGKFVQKPMPFESGGMREAIGDLLFDADGDGDLDLWCANGSNKWEAGSEMYADEFYRNDGKGNFAPDPAAFPKNTTSKSCIRAADIDGDGDLDVFIGGRCLPGNYPMPVSSFVYRNDSKDSMVKFTDITENICPKLKNIGMVCDAVWTDWNNDGKMDLVVAGEWMPLTFFKNENGKLADATAETGISKKTGWWNSLAAGDFDNDGDIDYVAGNLGLNAFIRGSEKEPVKVYANDFDGNGTSDPILTLWLKDDKGEKHEYTAMNRDDIMNQMPSLKKKFNAYKAFAAADIHHIFRQGQLDSAYTLEANTMASCFVRNDGNGKFTLLPLPPQAQMAPLNGMQVGDFNSDGNLDVAILGNDYGNEVTAGRYDAMNGLVLLGDGAGNFAPQTILQSGFYVPGDAKGLVALRNSEGKLMLAASQNGGAVKMFRSNAETEMVPVRKDDAYAIITMANGKKRKQELYWGSSFLSASGRYVEKNKSVKSVEVVNGKGEKRMME
ncbi:MAG: VCBS repeat-containing protein, partial [Williamsia sp.]|nr:VCBS repeat-containing protein [Williamsia sp.]